MRKLYWSLLTFFLSSKICYAQNLVPNGDFESYTQLPAFSGQWGLSLGWTNCGGYGSPDYFHMSGSGNAQLPNAFTSTVYPHGGSAIMGLALYESSFSDFREYVSRPLLTPLIVGQSYNLSFYVTNGTAPFNYGGYACDHFSIAFSTAPLSQSQISPLIINFTPQLIYVGLLYNNNWQLVTFNFTADSAYQHVTFGSFVSDTIQQIQANDSASISSGAYYFIDDIVLTETTGLEANQKTDISVLPSLFSNTLNIVCNNYYSKEVVLYDINLKKQLQLQFTNSITLNTIHLSKGIYIYEVRSKNGVIKKGKVVKE